MNLENKLKFFIKDWKLPNFTSIIKYAKMNIL